MVVDDNWPSRRTAEKLGGRRTTIRRRMASAFWLILPTAPAPRASATPTARRVSLGSTSARGRLWRPRPVRQRQCPSCRRRGQLLPERHGHGGRDKIAEHDISQGHRRRPHQLQHDPYRATGLRERSRRGRCRAGRIRKLLHDPPDQGGQGLTTDRLVHSRSRPRVGADGRRHPPHGRQVCPVEGATSWASLVASAAREHCSTCSGSCGHHANQASDLVLGRSS
jgi:hypothetical protein